MCKKCGIPKLIRQGRCNSNAFNIRVRDVKKNQIKHSDRKASRKELDNYKGRYTSKKNSKVGDAIFFGDSKHRVGHVGIIIDPDKKLMIHASSARGKVIISSYDTKYYKRKFRGIRRYS